MIPEAAVEAAARSLYRSQPIYHWSEGVTVGQMPWEWLESHHQKLMLSYARAALEAAAHHMLAGAWDEGHDACADELAKYENPYRPTP